MKRGKDEEKILEPMFPRLHVNDADKGGGPRAPPRNKMALYEQLSIPSQRFNDRTSASFPRNTSTTLVSPGPSNQVFICLLLLLECFGVDPYNNNNFFFFVCVSAGLWRGKELNWPSN